MLVIGKLYFRFLPKGCRISVHNNKIGQIQARSTSNPRGVGSLVGSKRKNINPVYVPGFLFDLVEYLKN